MSAVVWILLAVVILAVCSGGGKKKPAGPHRIDRPHVLDPDDYECSVCHRRFRKDQMVCPYCGTRFAERVTDEEEFIDEEEELEEWDDEEK